MVRVLELVESMGEGVSAVLVGEGSGVGVFRGVFRGVGLMEGGIRDHLYCLDRTP